MSYARAGQVLDEYNRPIAGAKVYVYTEGGDDAILTSDGTAALAQPVSTDAFGAYAYRVASAAVYREDTWFGGKLRYREIVAVGLDGLYPPQPRGGLFFAFDADGNPVATAGTDGADGTLRADLAAVTGAALVGQAKGGSVQTYIDTVPRRLNYANRPRITTDPDALTALATLHQNIVGYGSNAYAGTTGGLGKPIVYVNNPSLSTGPLYSLGRALQVAAANNGAQIYFDMAGHYPVILTNRLELTGLANLTVYAPGRNVVFWSDRLNGALNLGGANQIWSGLQFRSLPGPINGLAIGEDTSRAKSIVNVRADLSGAGQIAFMGCEFWHPSWHCLDIARATKPVGGDPDFNATIQNCIFWNAVQAHLLGVNNSQLGPGTYTTDTDTRKMFFTLYENTYAYCLQRLPKILGMAQADIANCQFILAPYPNENSTSPEIRSDSYGVGVQEGGWAAARGCLFSSAHTLTDATHAMQLQTAGYSGNTGYLSNVDCAAENGLLFETRNPTLIPAVPYVLPHVAVPAAGALRDAWSQQRWANGGARVDPAPLGLFLPVTGSTRVPDGESVVLSSRDDRTLYLERVDPLLEYAVAAVDVAADPLAPVSRGYTRTVGYTNGSASQAAIGPTMLDLGNADSPYFIAQGHSGAANVKHIVRSDGLLIQDGTNLRIEGASANPITFVSATSIAATADPTTDIVTVTAHGETVSGFQVQFSNSGGGLPAGLTINTVYYGIYIDGNTFKVAASYADATAATPIRIDITTAGTGTHTAVIGSFNLPRGRNLLVDNSSKITEFTLNSNNNRFSPQGVFALDATAANGDAAATLNSTSAKTQVFNTPLTANRGVTLATSDAQDGDKFIITRTAAATGASTVNVGTGPLKALAAGQWCEVTYSSALAAWVLSEFGSL